jgi:hypothetical protein
VLCLCACAFVCCCVGCVGASAFIIASLPVSPYKRPLRVSIDSEAARCTVCLCEFEAGEQQKFLPCVTHTNAHADRPTVQHTTQLKEQHTRHKCSDSAHCADMRVVCLRTCVTNSCMLHVYVVQLHTFHVECIDKVCASGSMREELMSMCRCRCRCRCACGC